MRLALIADTHLSSRAPECLRNWHAAAEAIAGWQPDLTVHLGDISLDAETVGADLDEAAALVAQWPTPMRLVAGNHDMGTGSGEEALSPDLMARCEAAFGSSRWALSRSGWTLLGINAQLLGTGGDEEAQQWQWLEERARALDPARDRCALFLHRPLLQAAADVPRTAGRYVVPEAVQRLLHGPLQPTLRLVFSGHTHQALDVQHEGVRHVWVPSTAFVIAERLQKTVGRKLVGYGLVELAADGAVRFELGSPDTLHEHEMTELAFYAELVAARS